MCAEVSLQMTGNIETKIMKNDDDVPICHCTTTHAAPRCAAHVGDGRERKKPREGCYAKKRRVRALEGREDGGTETNPGAERTQRPSFELANSNSPMNSPPRPLPSASASAACPVRCVRVCVRPAAERTYAHVTEESKPGRTSAASINYQPPSTPHDAYAPYCM